MKKLIAFFVFLSPALLMAQDSVQHFNEPAPVPNVPIPGSDGQPITLNSVLGYAVAVGVSALIGGIARHFERRKMKRAHQQEIDHLKGNL